MDNQQALKLLGLTGNEAPEKITQAYQTKLTLVETKCQSAPTEVLKQKFEQFKADLTQAHQLLTSPSTDQSTQKSSSPHSSPLSQTKMHDLPGAGPGAGNVDEVALEVGTVLAERYEIKAFIAQGGMGAVYSAFDKNRNEDIAIKVMLPALMKNETAKSRFLDEARLSSQLSHPNIVNVYDVQQVNGLCFLTMELLQGQDLRQLMENRQLVRQNFSLDDVIEILEPICAGLDHAHEITVHRDIKPENIYLTEDGKYKLMDFGIARLMSTSQRTQTGAASGTAYYMAPEQLKGAKNIDGRADQYALAVLTYELLSGEVPAGAIEPLHQLVKGISKKISLNVQKALSPKPENRFDNLADFLQALKGKGKGAGLALPALPMKGIGIAAAVLITTLGIGSLAGNGGLSALWEAIKPVDKELIAQQKAEAERVLANNKAEVAKLQGEIENYQKRLNNGQRSLNSDIRDAERNKSNDAKELKYLQHWQRLSDDYLFDGDQLIELEGELSKGDNLLRQGTTESIQQASTTLTQVRDGYKNLWAQFNGAENLLKAEEANNKAFNNWQKRKKYYSFEDPVIVVEATNAEKSAKNSQRDGDFKSAQQGWLAAQDYWQQAYSVMNDASRKIDNKRSKQKQIAEFAQVKKKNSLSAVSSYLKKYPNGLKTSEANQMLANLDDKHYAQAKNTNTISGYQQYLKNLPNGMHKSKVTAAIETINIANRKSKERRAEAQARQQEVAGYKEDYNNSYSQLERIINDFNYFDSKALDNYTYNWGTGGQDHSKEYHTMTLAQGGLTKQQGCSISWWYQILRTSSVFKYRNSINDETSSLKRLSKLNIERYDFKEMRYTKSRGQNYTFIFNGYSLDRLTFDTRQEAQRAKDLITEMSQICEYFD
jgi:serine/threonine protein kinase